MDNDGDMSSWTMDAMIDATELWSLDAYAASHTRIHSYPSVRGERKRRKHRVDDDDETMWKVMMDTKSKALVSVLRDDDIFSWLLPYGCTYISIKIPDHFATCVVSCGDVTTMPPANIDKLPITTEISSNLSQFLALESSPKNLQVSRMASPEEILVALEEIPGLDCDDLLKAYGIICRDNGCLLRSLLGLPMSMRKKWLLIEIKAYQDCPVCYASVERTLWKTLIATISGDIDGNCSSSVSWATAAQAAGKLLEMTDLLSNFLIFAVRESSTAMAPITEATSRSSSGHLVRVSFRPELSFRCSPCGKDGPSMDLVADHDDHSVVLLEMRYDKEGYDEFGIDYFVYNYAAADDDGDDDDPPRPPSLSLLPSYWDPLDEDERSWRQDPKVHQLDADSTGLLRRRRRRHGEDDLVVAELITTRESESSKLEEVKLLVLRSGEWSVTRAEIIHDGSKGEELSYWETDMAVPVGDRRLCWVDLYRGVILCGDDLFDEIPPRLQYVPLPVEAPAGEFEEDSDDESTRRCLMASRIVCATGGGATLKFIDVFPHCCCGDPGATLCDHSRNAFVINIWTLRIDGDGDHTMSSWTMDAMIDATELWSLDAYAGIPRVIPEYPVISTDDADVICFLVTEPYNHKQGKPYFERTTWEMTMDTKNKTLLSVCTYDDDISQREPSYGHTYIPNNFATKPPPAIICEATTTITTEINGNNLSQSLPSAKHLQVSRMAPEEILVALEEIPELSRDDLLKAYSILCRDNGRLFRSLLGLPMSLRKKWLLIEIKACRDCPPHATNLCNYSSNAFVINTWTLRMNDDDDGMEWTMDAIVDATKLWSLDAYASIPRITPEHLSSA
uniref:DUF1618 domain-containing protein n=1 Tax=Oryza nivara TaxID=4536 RepID=A0A0E0IYT6_ORYNI